MGHSQTPWRPNRRNRSHTLSNTSFCPFWRPVDTLEEIWYMAKTTMKSDFYLRSSTADLRYPKCWCRGWGKGKGALGEVCSVVFWTAARKSLMAVEFGQENSRLEVSEEAGICGSRSTSVCVLLGWLHFGHLSAPLLARKSVKRFSTYECGASGEYLPATCRPQPIDLHPFHTHAHTHTHCWTD